MLINLQIVVGIGCQYSVMHVVKIQMTISYIYFIITIIIL